MEKLLESITSAQNCALAIKKMSVSGQIVVMHNFHFYKQLDFLVKSVSDSLEQVNQLQRKMKCERNEKSTQTEITEIQPKTVKIDQLRHFIDTQTPEWPCSDFQTSSASVVTFSVFESESSSDVSPPRIDYSKTREPNIFNKVKISSKTSNNKPVCLEEDESERWEVIPQQELSSYSQSSNEYSCSTPEKVKKEYDSRESSTKCDTTSDFERPLEQISLQCSQNEIRDMVYREYRPELFLNQRKNILCKKKKKEPELENLEHADIVLKRKIFPYQQLDAQGKKCQKLMKKSKNPIEILE